MKTRAVGLCAGLFGLAGVTSAWSWDGLPAVPQALAAGKPNLDVRLRYEGVHQGNFADSARATTVRARLGYTTGSWNDVSLMLEYQGTTAIGDDEFNSTANGRTPYPVVADPSMNQVDQFWIAYAGLPHTVIRYGRQHLQYDDARFVGDAEFRQNWQTYDGLTLTGTWWPRLRFDYALLSNVDSFRENTIAGINTKNIDLRSSQLFHLSYAWARWLDTTAYAYLLNFAHDAPLPPAVGASLNDPRRDSATYGVRVHGAWDFVPLKPNYLLEYARQRPYASSPAGIDADYYRVELAASARAVGVKLGYEALGGDGRYGFQTPLATLHAFQGWADQFLITPPDGIEDWYVALSGTVEKIALQAVGHDFSPQHPGPHDGSELDLQATRPFGGGFNLGATYAHYFADHFPSASGVAYSTTKLWVWIEYKF